MAQTEKRLSRDKVAEILNLSQARLSQLQVDGVLVGERGEVDGRNKFYYLPSDVETYIKTRMEKNQDCIGRLKAALQGGK
jgi:predicted transcriptional regulator